MPEVFFELSYSHIGNNKQCLRVETFNKDLRFDVSNPGDLDFDLSNLDNQSRVNRNEEHDPEDTGSYNLVPYNATSSIQFIGNNLM